MTSLYVTHYWRIRTLGIFLPKCAELMRGKVPESLVALRVAFFPLSQKKLEGAINSPPSGKSRVNVGNIFKIEMQDTNLKKPAPGSKQTLMSVMPCPSLGLRDSFSAQQKLYRCWGGSDVRCWPGLRLGHGQPTFVRWKWQCRFHFLKGKKNCLNFV